MAGKISAIIPGSLAQQYGLAPQDSLLSINGHPLGDLIDYNYAAYSGNLQLGLCKANGELQQLEIQKAEGQDIGLVFEAEVFDGIRPCHNHCLFCFIDQLQPAPRASLLLKDDDYRMSFLEGNYITGTNLREEDFQRIAELRLSPLYVSVHCTDGAMRGYLLGHKGPAPVLPLLERLIACGADLHTQIVLCPGLNDGPILERTLEDLGQLYPGVASIAVVPVGLTRFQRRPELRLFSPEEAAALLEWLKTWQKDFLQKYGTRLVFAADELYIRAGLPFPRPGHYEEFSQLENGVGLAALFYRQWQALLRRQKRRGYTPQALPGLSGLVTGLSGAAALQPIVPDIAELSQGRARLIPVANSFYGPSITVTGLLTGTCLAQALPRGEYNRYIIPSHLLKHDSDLFLDDMTLGQLEEILQTPLIVAPNNAAGLFQALCGAK